MTDSLSTKREKSHFDDTAELVGIALFLGDQAYFLTIAYPLAPFGSGHNGFEHRLGSL